MLDLELEVVDKTGMLVSTQIRQDQRGLLLIERDKAGNFIDFINAYAATFDRRVKSIKGGLVQLEPGRKRLLLPQNMVGTFSCMVGKYLTDGRPDSPITLLSGYRTPISQAWLESVAGNPFSDCSHTVIAANPPELTSHAYPRVVDMESVDDFEGWLQAARSCGLCRPYGDADRNHYEPASSCDMSQADLDEVYISNSAKGIEAFQSLWKRNKQRILGSIHTPPIDPGCDGAAFQVDGVWGRCTKQALLRSPVGGFGSSPKPLEPQPLGPQYAAAHPSPIRGPRLRNR